MRLNVAFREEEERIEISDESLSEKLNVVFGETQTISDINYNNLRNKPSINAVELIGDKSFDDLGLSPITAVGIETILQS